MYPPPSTLSEEKALLRREFKAKRAALSLEERQAASRTICEMLLASSWLEDAKIIGAFWSLSEEVLLQELLQTLAARGHRLALPVTRKRGESLFFRLWSPEVALVRESFGTYAPPPSQPACRPSHLLVPLLAFDRRGFRLGYGAGHYDRSLAALREDGESLSTLGLAFAIQEAQHLPTDQYDQRLDAILTEKAWIVSSSS